MATIGDDGGDYRERLDAFGIGVDALRHVPGTYTAQAFIINDLDDNQITAFHPGAMAFSHQNRVGDVRDIGLGIVAPDGREGMWSHVEQFAQAGIPFVFDPGQGMPLFDGPELLTMIEHADYVAVNDYEGRLLEERTGIPLAGIAEQVKALIVTLGGDGSVIYADGTMIAIPAAKPAAILDPTGCGDAYRAGLLYGIAQDWDWERTGGLASVHGRAQDRVARRAEPRGQPGDRGRALSRDVRRRALVTRRDPPAAKAATHAHRNPLPVRCYRWTRTCVHVLRRRRHDDVRVPAGERRAAPRAGQALERAAAADPRGGGARRRRVRRARRQRARRREPHLVARHLRAQRRASGALRREVRAREVAGRVADDPRRGHRVHRARAPARHAPREPPDGAACSPAATSSRSSRRGRRPTAPTCCRSRARCCSRSSRPRVTCSRSRSAIARPTAPLRWRPPTSATRRSPRRSGRVCGERRITVAPARAARAARARRPPARTRARGGGVYPNGFGWTGERDGT